MRWRRYRYSIRQTRELLLGTAPDGIIPIPQLASPLAGLPQPTFVLDFDRTHFEDCGSQRGAGAFSSSRSLRRTGSPKARAEGSWGSRASSSWRISARGWRLGELMTETLLVYDEGFMRESTGHGTVRGGPSRLRTRTGSQLFVECGAPERAPGARRALPRTGTTRACCYSSTAWRCRRTSTGERRAGRWWPQDARRAARGPGRRYWRPARPSTAVWRAWPPGLARRRGLSRAPLGGGPPSFPRGVSWERLPVP
jgi:hypothetical protein